jgi:receptor protein-tyrosine kinase
MSRVYDAMRRLADERNGATDAANHVAAQLPALVVTEDLFPPELTRTEGAGDAAGEALISSPAAALQPASDVTSDSAPRAESAVAAQPPKKTHTFTQVDGRYEGKTLLDLGVSGQSREQYRRVATCLHHSQAISGTRVVMVTSALVAEGKTLTAANVALTLSESYKKNVLLIDADFRRPSLHAIFGVNGTQGLADALLASDDEQVHVRQVSPRLGILLGGRPISDPIAALTSDRMRQLIEEARKSFDWVIIDTPPVALLTDANLVAAITDGVLMVVKAGHTPWHIVDRAVQAIGRERTLGVVLNRANEYGQGSTYYNYYYDSYYPGTGK